MKAYLTGLNNLNGVIEIPDGRTPVVYMALFGKLNASYIDEISTTEQEIKKAVFQYKGMMPIYEFIGVE